MALDDGGYPASNAYGLTMVPTIFLIEPDGSVKVSCMGFRKKDLETIASELADAVRSLLPPCFARTRTVPAHKPG